MRNRQRVTCTALPALPPRDSSEPRLVGERGQAGEGSLSFRGEGNDLAKVVGVPSSPPASAGPELRRSLLRCRRRAVCVRAAHAPLCVSAAGIATHLRAPAPNGRELQLGAARATVGASGARFFFHPLGTTAAGSKLCITAGDGRVRLSR